MILCDYHLHSTFSGDGKADMGSVIEAAIALKIKTLCFTEHHDLDVPYTVPMTLDFDRYLESFFRFREIYAEKIDLRCGVELGIQPHLYTELSRIAKTYPFDFVLCSNHVVGGIDPYMPEYFEGKTKEAGYTEYFEEILRNVRNYNDYDVYGHLDYVIRYGFFPDKHYLYAEYRDVLDAILKVIIESGHGIELNASGFKYGLKDSHPSHQVIKRYKALGGEIITVGSDAHNTDQLLNYFDLAENILLEAGFKYYTIFKNRKPEFVRLG